LPDQRLLERVDAPQFVSVETVGAVAAGLDKGGEPDVAGGGVVFPEQHVVAHRQSPSSGLLAGCKHALIGVVHTPSLGLA
jgi:hypothetical protein